jgi:hypothetical protein
MASCYASLAEIPERSTWSMGLPADRHGRRVVEEAIAIGARIIWMQLGCATTSGGARRGARHPGRHGSLPGDRDPAAGAEAKLRGNVSARFVALTGVPAKTGTPAQDAERA